MEVEDQFRAAVRIMRSLPKDGPFQPSKEMSLRLRSFYMQSQFGPCDLDPPKFWEWSKKLEYNAWKSLGSMSRQEAMQCYTDDLKKIIETMSFNSNVAGFLRTCGPFYEFVDENSEESENGSYHVKCDEICYNTDALNLEQEFSLEDWNGDYESESSTESESVDDVFFDSLNYVDTSCHPLESLVHNIREAHDLKEKLGKALKESQDEELKDWIPTSEVGSMSLDSHCGKNEALHQISENVQLLSNHLSVLEKKIDDILIVLGDMRKNKVAGEESKLFLTGVNRPMRYLLILSCPLLLSFAISASKRLW